MIVRIVGIILFSLAVFSFLYIWLGSARIRPDVPLIIMFLGGWLYLVPIVLAVISFLLAKWYILFGVLPGALLFAWIEQKIY